MRTKLMSIASNYNSGMQLGYEDQVVIKAWSERTRTPGMASMQNAPQPYVIYNNLTVMFEVICSREEWYALQLQ